VRDLKTDSRSLPLARRFHEQGSFLQNLAGALIEYWMFSVYYVAGIHG
jgi:hypothetical protein